MTVNELIEDLIMIRDVNPGGGNLIVVLSGDQEGNYFNELSGTGFGVWDGEELRNIKDTKEDTENAFVLWP